MRLRLVLCVVVAYLVGAGSFWLLHENETVSADDEEPTCIAGDTNGDGTVNIGDAVWILGYLFAGGEPPVPCECDVCEVCDPAHGLPTTGQEECFDHMAIPIECDDEDYPGQDGYYQASIH